MNLTRRDFLNAAAAAAVTPLLGHANALAQVTGAVDKAGAGARPNVIVLLTDDQGYADLSCHGNPIVKTPNMDRLHDESVRFTDFHVAPMCTPTRGQLMTGMDALRNGATSVCSGRSFIRPGIPTMAGIFRGAGYRTGLFGKWHLGDSYPNRPMDKGFEDAVYFKGWGLSSAPEFDNDYFDGRCIRNGKPDNFKGYCTDFWFKEAMDWIKQRKTAGEPFFCYLPTNAPHSPLWVDPKDAKPYEGRGPANFYGMIANIDDNLAKLEAMLKETGLRDNTIVVFLTDNGGTAGVQTYNAGMRAGKTTYYDGGHRAACFVRWPAGNLRAADIDLPAQVQDVLPTLLDLCGVQRPASAQFDGVSLKPLLLGLAKPPADRMLVVQYGQILKKWDSCVIWNQWQLVRGEELYDIRADLAQKNNVADKHPEVVEPMRQHYEKWWAGIAPKIDDYVPIVIGAEQENPVSLCSSDWEGIYCDNTHAIRSAAGGERGGPWNIQVQREGEYEIALRRWPARNDVALSAPMPEQQMKVARLVRGKAMPIAKARMTVAGQDVSKDVAAKDTAARFTVKLPAGRTQLHAWFQDAAGKDLCGAFYAEVKRL